MNNIDPCEVKKDIDVILWSAKLACVRRYFHQRFWERETIEAEHASLIEPFPRLESVAEHTWHVVDTIILIVRHFPSLNIERSLKLAILHDKMEILIDDKNPVGRDGTGMSTHAFNIEKKGIKDGLERAAIQKYVSKLPASARQDQNQMLLELLEGITEESRFVKAVDKLQALAFVLLKKKGMMGRKHLNFTQRYSQKVVDYYPPLQQHFQELLGRLMTKANDQIKYSPNQEQLALNFDGSDNGAFSSDG